MAVKVIKKAEPTEKTYKNCKTLLSYEYEDIKSEKLSCFDEIPSTYYFVKCPNCTAKVYVK